MKSLHNVELIDKVRKHHELYSKSVDTVESIYLAFRTIVERTKQSPQPKPYLFLDFQDENTGFGLYWNTDDVPTDEINITVWIAYDHYIDTVIDKNIKIVDRNYFAVLFECAQYLQDNYPNIIKSMSLENIIFTMMSKDIEIQVNYASHFAFPNSRYIPLPPL